MSFIPVFVSFTLIVPMTIYLGSWANLGQIYFRNGAFVLHGQSQA